MGIEGTEVLTTHECDVIVVGGGPSGLIAARDLAAQGFHAIVLEEHDSIGAPVHCTGVLGLDAFDELDLSRRSILSIAQSARFVSADGTSVVVDAERVRAAVIDRTSFDRDLAERARAAGAVVRTGERVRGIDAQPSSVIVQTLRTTVRARAAVIACGAMYRFNRALGMGLPRLLAHSAQVEVPFPNVDHVEVHLGTHIGAGGFAWLVPFQRSGDPFARVGVMCDTGAASRFRAFADRVRQDHGVYGEWPHPRLKVLPLAPVERTWAHRVLAVGDAAGLVKPTTGGGIYYGLLTGRMAAEVLGAALRANCLEATRLKEYQLRWRKRLGPEIRVGLAFRAVARSLSDGAIDTLIELARVNGIIPLLAQTADFNWHRTAALSLLRNASFRRVVVSSIWS